MTIDTSNWGEFRVGDLFDIKKGKRLTAEDQTKGNIPYIGAIDSNNGVSNFIGQNPIHKGNTISLSYNGSVAEAFYQPKSFWATDDVNVLYFKESNNHRFNQYIALFICCILRQEKYRYTYGRKWELEKMENTTIILPQTQDGQPDWNYMEQFMKSLNWANIETKNKKTDMKLDVDGWKEYKINDLFDVTSGNYHSSESYTEGNTNYLSASNENNGVAQKINLSPEFNGNCIVTGKIGCTAFYESEDFCATSDVNILIPKFKMTKEIGMFITTIINKSENYKWTYGRQCRIKNTENIIIKLPSTQSGQPNWEFMEQYIKSLPYGDLLN